jgi:hypothetical protein
VHLVVSVAQQADYLAMTNSSDDAEQSHPVPLEMDFRVASFPSDSLSVKRLRLIFPKHFDGQGLIVDGFANNDFFFPSAAEKPDHLMRLTELICDERVVAAGAFCETRYGERRGYREESQVAEERECIVQSKRRLEENLQRFKLADSPETARMLIRQIEEQGEQQARAAKSVDR